MKVIRLLVKITNNTLILVKDDVIDLENFAIKIRAYAFFFRIYMEYCIVVKYIKSKHILISECCLSNFGGSLYFLNAYIRLQTTRLIEGKL